MIVNRALTSVTTRLLLVLFLPLAGLVSCSGRAEAPASIFPQGVSLRQGDVVMRRGLGFASRAVTFADRGGAYSHVGIVVKGARGWMVAHAVPGEPDFPGDEDRVKLEPLEMYFRSDRACEGCVLRHEDSLLAMRAARAAETICGRGVLFDHDYDDADTTRLYCCELVEVAFRRAGGKLVGRGTHDVSLPGFWLRGVVLPSDYLSLPSLRRVVAF